MRSPIRVHFLICQDLEKILIEDSNFQDGIKIYLNFSFKTNTVQFFAFSGFSLFFWGGG